MEEKNSICEKLWREYEPQIRKIYRDNLTHYSVQLNGCTFDEAKQFAMTIK